MPRSPRVRTRDGSASLSSARRAWLSQLKEESVRQLPPTASAAVRTKLRIDVERALRHRGPDDPPLELQDVLATLVAETLMHLHETGRQAQQVGMKAELVTFAKWALGTALNECPTHLVGAPGSGHRTQTTRVVWAELGLIL